MLVFRLYDIKIDIDLDEWIKSYFAENAMYIINQKQNYLQMVASLQKGMVA